jgi:hypothetical protein
MAPKDYKTTAEGIEMQFGVNHIGHFLLTYLLMEKILASKSGARIINLSSLGYIMSGIRDDWNFEVLVRLACDISTCSQRVIERAIQLVARVWPIEDLKYPIRFSACTEVEGQGCCCIFGESWTSVTRDSRGIETISLLTIKVIPGTQLQASAEVTEERFAEGYAITLKALKGMFPCLLAIRYAD